MWLTELSDEHLVPLDMSALTIYLVMKSRRDDDSLEFIDDEETLLDERLCLEEQGCDPMDSPRPSFVLHSPPDKSTALFRQKMGSPR